MTTKNKQVKQPFYAINETVYIKPLKVKGVVKGYLDGLTVVTYYIKNKRRTNKFEAQMLRKYKNKHITTNDGLIKIDLNGNLHFKNAKIQYYDHSSDFFKVRKFQKAFNCPAPEEPSVLSDKLAMNRASFILEEVIELLYATSGNKERFDKFFAELILNAEETYKKQLTKSFPEDRLIGQIDALIDIKYFTEGGLVEASVVPDRIFDLVHQANMSKIFPDGKPHYNEVGKVIKPEGWEAPEPKIEEEVKRQIKLGSKRFK
ncbi:hypothetical protein L8C07_06190 [Paenibacillus sp. CMAA1739]|uniref:hypothetical protein n=1 Tax=Paenibacillus ottowii TaxID=2315729 RepID=UPI002DBBC528|nr:hypothetical protein [Paenibacillus sp. CMAA1739]MEC4565530.1 hypothetical protein [Paenibacillus sp. CMAA1739]